MCVEARPVQSSSLQQKAIIKEKKDRRKKHLKTGSQGLHVATLDINNWLNSLL